LIEVADLRQWTTQIYGVGQLGQLADLSATNLSLDIIGYPVRAYGCASNALYGQIAALFYRSKTVGGFEYVADFLIGSRTDKPLVTRPGDSGTVWVLETNDQNLGLVPIGVQWGGGVFATGRSKQFPFALATKEFERFMIADRMRRGKRSKAKQGKLVASPQSDYGFRYNETRDGYEVDEVRMALVRRIFRMVGVEGMTLNAVGTRLEAEGIPAPRGGRTWNRPTLRKFVLSDVYLRHSYEEVARIVSGEVAATLDPSAHYGISWYGKQRHTHSREVRVKDGKKSVDVPREDWIGVPVPGPGIPREWVLAARDAIKNNEKVSNCGRRFWELTGGVLRCAACGGAMATTFHPHRKMGYYRCGKRYRFGTHACSQGRNFRA